MHKHGADYTNTFRALTFNKPEDTALHGHAEFADWLERWQGRLERQPESMEASQALMRSSNPALIPRNHRVEEALDAAQERGDYSVMRRLLEVLEHPYAHAPEQEEYSAPPEPSQRPYRTYCGT